jgi:hypothetical protein
MTQLGADVEALDRIAARHGGTATSTDAIRVRWAAWRTSFSATDGTATSSATTCGIPRHTPSVRRRRVDRARPDHQMTPELGQRLDQLAAAVRREWPGLKLHVTEAWDDNAHLFRDDWGGRLRPQRAAVIEELDRTAQTLRRLAAEQVQLSNNGR